VHSERGRNPKGGSKDKKDAQEEGTEREGDTQGAARDERGSAGKRGGGIATVTARFWEICYLGRPCI